MSPRIEQTVLEQYTLTLGFVPLTDCALLAVARERGLFEAEGLEVRLSREASWANIRDKVASGLLDGAHMLAPMALASSLGAAGPAEAMVVPMSLNANGSSIGVSAALAARMGPEGSAADLPPLIRERAAAGQPPLTFAVVFPFSLHAYMLRAWLSDAGIDPDRDVRITVIPPPRIAARVAAGEVDGFCVGAPWGGMVERSGAGRMVVHGHAFWPGAPDKVLGVTEAWAKRRPLALQALLRALVRAALWAEDPANEAALADLLGAPAYLDAPPEAVRRAIAAANPHRLRFHSDGAGCPRPEHAQWILEQMRRWGQVEAAPGQEEIARATYRPDLYLQAVAAVGAPVPAPEPLPLP